MLEKTVLLVEDSATDALIVKHALRQQFQVEHVRTPQEAQARLEKGANYAAVILDYCLPGMDGLALQRWIVERGLDLPIVVMSGRGDERVAAEALKLGAYDYVVKNEDTLASIGVILQQARARHELEQRAQMLQQIVENASDAIFTMCADGRILTANRAVEAIFGYAPEETTGQPLTLLFPDQGDGGVRQMLAAGSAGRIWQGELPARRKDGTAFPVHVSCSVLRDRNGRPQCLIGIARDVTERREFLDKLRRLSVTDNLTGLYNHRFFHDRLRYEFMRARRYGNHLSCIMLDVDFFKTVNDTYGHLAGDQVLKSLAAIIQRATRAADIAARYGGEEFAVLLPNTDLAGAIRCAEHLWETIGTAEIETGQGLLRLTVSVGVAALDPDVKDEEDLCRRADAALLAAKRRGRNNVYAWDQLLLEPDQAVPILDSSDPEELRNNLNRLIAPAKAKYIEAVRPLMESLCQRDPELQRQTTNITIFALELARAAGMSAEETEALHRAALFHVIAHAATPAGQSHEPRAPVLCSRLLPEYATPGEKLVRGLGVFELEMEYLRHYCERWDGSGGPDGLTGKAIPLGARILAIATTYHALLTGAAGRGPVDEKKALAELRRHAGTRFDPDLVEMFVEARVAVSIL